MNYKVYGNGHPLLILHGFLGSLDNWHTIANELSNSCKVFAIDLRNHGKSFHASSHTIQDMVDDLYAFIQTHELKMVHLMGHSMGGKFAMEFALQHPTIVNHLIVVDIAPKQYKRGHDDVLKALEEVHIEKMQTRKEVENALMPYLPDFGVRQFVMKNLERLETGNYQWKMNVPVLLKDYEQVVKAIEPNRRFLGDVLFIRGGNSLYIQDNDLIQIAELFPRYELETIVNAGHWVHADQALALKNSVLKFLKGINEA